MSQIRNQNYPNGLNPLNYMGVNAANPAPQVIQSTQAPLPTNTNFPIGTQWAVTTLSGLQYWVLLNLDGNVATWVQIFPGSGGGGGASEFPTDSEVAIAVDGVLNVFGDGLNTNTTGSGDTVMVNLNPSITVDSVTDTSLGLGIVQASAGGLLSSSNGTNGQLLIGSTGVAPTWTNLTAGANVTITNAPNSIMIAAAGGGGGGITTLTGNSGPGATGASVKIQGNAPITTSAAGAIVQVGITNGTNGQLLIAGGATPAWNNLTSTGATVAITYPSNNNINLEATGTSPAAGCAFFYYQATRASNVLGTQTFYGLGATVVMTALFDNSGAVTPGNGAGTPLRFTAPATGLYFLSMVANTQPSTSSTAFPSAQITITGNPATANTYFLYNGALTSGAVQTIPALAANMFPMTAGDVAIFQVTRYTNGTLNAHVNGVAAFSSYPSAQSTWISGYRVA